MKVHRADVDGKALCGADNGGISVSGVCVTCEDCRNAQRVPTYDEKKAAWDKFIKEKYGKGN